MVFHAEGRTYVSDHALELILPVLMEREEEEGKGREGGGGREGEEMASLPQKQNQVYCWISGDMACAHAPATCGAEREGHSQRRSVEPGCGLSWRVVAAGVAAVCVALAIGSNRRLEAPWQRLAERRRRWESARSMLTVARLAEARQAGARAVRATVAVADGGDISLSAAVGGQASRDAVQALRGCLLDQKMRTYDVASLVTKSKLYSACLQKECDDADMPRVEDCQLSVQAFGECFAPFDDISRASLIGAEACTQKLQGLSVDKYIQKHVTSFSLEDS